MGKMRWSFRLSFLGLGVLAPWSSATSADERTAVQRMLQSLYFVLVRTTGVDYDVKASVMRSMRKLASLSHGMLPV